MGCAPSCVGTIPFGRARLADRAPEPMVGLWEGLVSFHFSLTYNQPICSEINTRQRGKWP